MNYKILPKLVNIILPCLVIFILPPSIVRHNINPYFQYYCNNRMHSSKVRNGMICGISLERFVIINFCVY